MTLYSVVVEFRGKNSDPTITILTDAENSFSAVNHALGRIYRPRLAVEHVHVYRIDTEYDLSGRRVKP
jgi:hypothetical protein